MKRFIACCALLALAASASAEEPPSPRSGPRHGSYADPSAVIAAELAFARLARDQGQWTAFAKTAAPGAVMFVPQRVNALAWLKRRANPPVAVRWQPYEVWMSCDGSYAITRGAWQRTDSVGYFTTIWQRQKKGGYKWVLDQGDELKQPLPAPEMLSGKVADCRAAGPAPASSPPQGLDAQAGSSRDRTLQWTSWVWPDGARQVSAWLWNGTAFDRILNLRVAASPSG